LRYEKTEYYKDDLYEGDLIYYAISRDEYRADDSQYSLRPVAGDDTRISFGRAFWERQREWKSAKAGAE
jgi:hypothetical protein